MLVGGWGDIGRGVAPSGHHEAMEEIRTTAEVFDEDFGRGNGWRRTEVRAQGRQVQPNSIHTVAIPRYGYTWLQVSLCPVSAGLWVVMWINTMALMFYGMAYVTRNVTTAVGELSVRQLEAWAHQVGVECGDLLAGQFSGVVGYPPGPAAAATLAAGAFVGRRVVRAVSSGLAPRRQTVHMPPTAAAPAAKPRTHLDGVIPCLAEAREKRAARIAGVQAALAQLDAEWLSYEMDLDAYYLTKPLLRDPAVAQTAAYRSALYELRALAEDLGSRRLRPNSMRPSGPRKRR